MTHASPFTCRARHPRARQGGQAHLHEEVQHEEVQHEEVQHEEVQDEEVQDEEVQGSPAGGRHPRPQGAPARTALADVHEHDRDNARDYVPRLRGGGWTPLGTKRGSRTA